LKAVVLNSKLRVLHQAEVKFDEDLGEEFNISGGVSIGENKNEFFVNPVMWVKALDTVLDRLILEGAIFSTVIGIAGCGQQHG
jgi:xylulokinase